MLATIQTTDNFTNTLEAITLEIGEVIKTFSVRKGNGLACKAEMKRTVENATAIDSDLLERLEQINLKYK